MTIRAAFKQADVQRAVNALLASGLPVAGVEVSNDSFVVLVGEARQIKRRNKADGLYGPA